MKFRILKLYLINLLNSLGEIILVLNIKLRDVFKINEYFKRDVQQGVFWKLFFVLIKIN